MVRTSINVIVYLCAKENVTVTFNAKKPAIVLTQHLDGWLKYNPGLEQQNTKILKTQQKNPFMF